MTPPRLCFAAALVRNTGSHEGHERCMFEDVLLFRGQVRVDRCMIRQVHDIL